jgi:hypothetical protein
MFALPAGSFEWRANKAMQLPRAAQMAAACVNDWIRVIHKM